MLGRLLEIHESDPQRLSFREIVGAMSINVYENLLSMTCFLELI